MAPSTWQDLINGLFEVGGGVAILGHCFTLMKDKIVKGVNWASVLFFTIWGIWNIYYYPHLNQWYSFLGGLLIAAGNAWWITLIVKYKLAEKRNKKLMALQIQNYMAQSSSLRDLCKEVKDGLGHTAYSEPTDWSHCKVSPGWKLDEGQDRIGPTSNGNSSK
jgi:predicted membrane channel-forming protein YqfA (hemolysin III family)